MDLQMVVNAALLLPAAVFGVLAVRARRRGRVLLGLGWSRGGWLEALSGLLFGTVLVGVVFALFVLTGLSVVDGVDADVLPLLGIAVYFLLLFVVEEILFRALLMNGLGVVAGRAVGLVVTSVLVAIPYAFAAGSGVVPVVGAVLTNLVNGMAFWQTGRIWFGMGMRLAWNTVQVALGFSVSGYLLAAPLVQQHLEGPDLLTGGSYGPEGGVVGLAIRGVMLVLMVALLRGRLGPWRIEPADGP